MVRTWMVAWCLLVSIAGCAGSPPASSAPTPDSASGTPPQQYHATELRPGDCVEPLPETFTVTVVPCDVPHSAEFATTYVLPEGPYPGAEMTRLMEVGCLPRMRIEDSKRDEMGLWGLWPAQEDWPRTRTVYCLAAPLDGRKITGRVVK